MGLKGDASRTKILRKAQALFAGKGYSAVTMQDICRETGLSRGGLYRYFGSTEEIFKAIIENEQQRAMEILNWAKNREIAPKLMLTTFLKLMINTRVTSEMSFDNAVSEFAANSKEGKEILVKRALTSIEIITDMIESGCAVGEFNCENPRAVATHILWILEAMIKHHALIPLTQEVIDEQMKLIDKLLY
ncbi:MAG: TetR/AcrR family transcriptional regulator [Ruminococcus sp.]